MLVYLWKVNLIAFQLLEQILHVCDSIFLCYCTTESHENSTVQGKGQVTHKNI